MDISRLDKICPKKVLDELQGAIEFAGITSPTELAHFLSQCHHESGGFNVVSENLNYSAKGLNEIFPKYFDTKTALKYERKPEAIANRVYANRLSNGNEASGDGWKFRGRGYIQLTGAANYLLFGNSIQVTLLQSPELVATKYPLLSAAWFWKRNVKPRLKPTSTVSDITKLINGGLNGLEDRQNLFNKYLSVLS